MSRRSQQTSFASSSLANNSSIESTGASVSSDNTVKRVMLKKQGAVDHGTGRQNRPLRPDLSFIMRQISTASSAKSSHSTDTDIELAFASAIPGLPIVLTPLNAKVRKRFSHPAETRKHPETIIYAPTESNSHEKTLTSSNDSPPSSPHIGGLTVSMKPKEFSSMSRLPVISAFDEEALTEENTSKTMNLRNPNLSVTLDRTPSNSLLPFATEEPSAQSTKKVFGEILVSLHFKATKKSLEIHILECRGLNNDAAHSISFPFSSHIRQKVPSSGHGTSSGKRRHTTLPLTRHSTPIKRTIAPDLDSEPGIKLGVVHPNVNSGRSGSFLSFIRQTTSPLAGRRKFLDSLETPETLSPSPPVIHLDRPSSAMAISNAKISVPSRPIVGNHKGSGTSVVEQVINPPNPYVKLYLLPNKSADSKRKTRTKHRTCHPIYNEMFVYNPVSNEELTFGGLSLEINVFHRELIGKNVFLGQVIIPLKDYKFQDLLPKWYRLKDKFLK